MGMGITSHEMWTQYAQTCGSSHAWSHWWIGIRQWTFCWKVSWGLANNDQQWIFQGEILYQPEYVGLSELMRKQKLDEFSSFVKEIAFVFTNFVSKMAKWRASEAHEIEFLKHERNKLLMRNRFWLICCNY